MTLRARLRCRLLKRHRWARRRGRGDEEYWQCEDCGAFFAGARPTGESKYGAPGPLVGRYRDDP